MWKDFKPHIFRNTQVSQESSDDAVEDTGMSSYQDDSAVEAELVQVVDVNVAKDLPEITEKSFAAVLLKLEHFALVPGTKIDAFLEDLHCLLSSATLPLSIDILEKELQKRSPTTERPLVAELATALCTSNPLLKVIEKGGALSSTYLRNPYYKKKL